MDDPKPSVEMFPIGSLVHLKSGGPKMTVVYHDFDVLRKEELRDIVHCAWFTLAGELRDASFDIRTLRLTES